MPTRKPRPRTAQSIRHLLPDPHNTITALEDDKGWHQLKAEMDKVILTSPFSPQAVLNLIIQKCLSQTASTRGHVVQYRRNRLLITASSEPDRIGQELPLESSLCGKAIVEGKTQHSKDASEVPGGKYVRYHPETKSELVVLIKPEHSARTLGVLDLERDKLGFFAPSEVAFVELLAGQAAIAIRNALTWSSVNMLYEINANLLTGDLTIEESYREILDAILEGLDFEHGQLLRLVGDELVVLASSCKENVGLRLGEHTSICGRYLVSEEGRDMLIIDDIDASSFKEFYLGLLQDEGKPMRSELIVPLIENNRLIGALNIESLRIGTFDDVDRTLLAIVSRFLTTAISATSARTTKANQERVYAATLAMTQLGNVAQSFLHRFANNVGDARGRLMELTEFLADKHLPPIRADGITVSEFITNITDTLQQSGEIISAFSDRFDPTDSRFKVEEMDLKLVVASTVERAIHRHREDSIRFQFEDRIPSGANRTPHDVSGLSVCHLTPQVFEVIGNLLDNAVEAILDKTPPCLDGRVDVVLDLPDPFHVRLQVKDNGAGIADNDKHHVFEFGYTTRKKRASLGIGLWFCDLYVRQRGGKITFHSVLGDGTTFELVLPTILASAAPL